MQGYVGKDTWERVHDGHGHLRKVTWVRELGKTHMSKGTLERAYGTGHIGKSTYAREPGQWLMVKGTKKRIHENRHAGIVTFRSFFMSLSSKTAGIVICIILIKEGSGARAHG